jgi:hypothetical protein
MKLILTILAFFQMTILCAQQHSAAVVSDKPPKEYALTLVSQSFQDSFFVSPYIKIRTNRYRSKLKIRDASVLFSRLTIKTNYNKNRVRVKLKIGKNELYDKLKYTIQDGKLNSYKVRAEGINDKYSFNIYNTEIYKLKINFGRVENRYLGGMKIVVLNNINGVPQKSIMMYDVNFPAIENLILVDEEIRILIPSLKLKTQ